MLGCQIAQTEDSQNTGHHPGMNDDGPGFAWQHNEMSAEKKNQNPSEKSQVCLQVTQTGTRRWAHPFNVHKLYKSIKTLKKEQ